MLADGRRSQLSVVCPARSGSSHLMPVPGALVHPVPVPALRRAVVVGPAPYVLDPDSLVLSAEQVPPPLADNVAIA